MASVEDRWTKPVKDAAGKPVLTEAGKAKRERSERYGHGLRWLVRWREPGGNPRKISFGKRIDADAHASTVEADKLRGTYLDIRAGSATFGEYAAKWQARQTTDPLTRQEIAARLRRYVEPYDLWKTPLNGIRPGVVQSWLGTLDTKTTLAASTVGVVFAHVSCILNAALDDELVAKNACRAASVQPPRVDTRKIVPWVREWVTEMHDALGDRYAVFATLGAGLGLRQGELFGLSPDDVDWLRGMVRIQRQVKLVGSKLVFALPKGRKIRDIPLPESVKAELAAYLAAFPAKTVTLPWEEPGGKPTTVKLAVTTRQGNACNRNQFNAMSWKPAQVKVGIPSERVNGMHALRHFFASVLLDARESIMAVSEYLGHSSAAITLRYYAHLMPASEARTKAAIDAMLAPRNADGSFVVTTASGAANAPSVPHAVGEVALTRGSTQNSRF